MKDNKHNNLIEKYIEKYSKKDFEFIISLLQISKLIEPIRASTKKYREYTKGFRPDSLSIKQVQSIYYKCIFEKNDDTLAIHTEMLLNKYLQKIDASISELINSVEIVRTNIENNDMESFDKLTTLLLENKFKEKENIALYFKMIDYVLTDEQNKYLEIDLIKKIEYRTIESHIKDNLIVTYENKAREMEEKHKTLLADKEREINFLQQNIDHFEKNVEYELSTQKKIINNMEEDKNMLFEEFSLEIESYKDKMSNLESLLDMVKEENNEKDNIISSLSDAVDLKYSDFSTIANERWMKLNEQLLQERGIIQSSIAQLKVSEEEIVKEISCLQDKKYDLEKNILSFENQGGKIVNNIQNILNAIGFNGDNTNNQSKLYKVPSVTLETELEEINDKLYFIDDLSTNLGICGISNEYSFDLAQYMFSTFANKMSLLLVGYNTSKIADAVSYIINGASAETITLPLGYNDCNELSKIVNSSKSRVILIENAVDNISESIYIPLIKQNTDKFLLFSMESPENIGLIPKSILNYLTMIDLDILISYEDDSELLVTGMTNQDIFDVDIEISSISTNLRHINGLDSVIKLSNVAKLKMAKIMSTIDKQNSQNAMYDILMFSIYMLCKSSDKTDALKEFIEKQEFKPVILKMLQSAMGDDIGDE